MKHEAVYALYPNVKYINNDIPYDANDNEVTVDINQVNAWTDPNQYKFDRQAAYKSIAEQLDMQYWDKVNGTNLWQEYIDAVKAAHPKPTE